MNRIFTVLSLLVSILFTFNAEAQNRCGSMSHLATQLQADPAMAARRQFIEQQTAAFIANPANLQPGARAIITIPVVVHVVYRTATENISQAQVQSQIDRLNLDFHKLNTDISSVPSVWTSLVADYQIQFCLASRDPNGNFTTGIVRTSTSSTSFIDDDKVKYTAQGGDNAWPAASYLNLWSCNLGGGLLGYAQFPGGPAATDGVVINYTAFGSTGTATAPYNLGRTATHEIGHWMNLYHIWGDDGGACSGSDNVNDTPNQGSEHYGCPSFPTVSCTNGPNGDMFMNYMDYTDDRCMYMFTNGQYARSSAIFASGGSRYSITTSLGCQGLVATPTANFSTDVTQTCTGVVNFVDASTGSPTTWAWTFGDGGTSAQQNPTHTYAANGTYTVTLTVTNANGSNTKTNTNYITVNKPSAPTVTGASRCGSGTLTLSATASDVIKWYAGATDVSSIATGTSFTTPSLNNTTTYYVENAVTGSTYHVGLANNSAGGGYLNSSQYLIFNVIKAGTLQSVYVYANGAGNRTFELKNSGGTVLSTLTVNVPTGGSRVTLNFPLTIGTGYQLGCPSGSTINLYRNTAGVAYPYNDAGGFVSITANTANDNTRYYWCYDWIIAGPDCASSRTPVVATINPAVTLTTSTTNAACGANTGTALVLVTAGTPAYTYAWSNSSVANSLSALAVGTYTVSVHDSRNCSATASAVVGSASAPTATAAGAAINCFGGTGTVSLTVTNGTSPYSYTWNNGANTASLSNVVAGTYNVTITDNAGCTTTATKTLTQPTALTISFTTNNASCGNNNGSAAATISGGTSGYTYLWSNGATLASLSNVGAGTYTLTVTDAHSCTASSSSSVASTAGFTSTKSFANATCFGNATGTAAVTVSNGTSPFTYHWTSGQNTASVNNLTAGNYFVTITDANNCVKIDSFVITEPAALNLNANAVNALCFGQQNGSASANATGGTPNYSYHWSTNAVGNAINNLTAGTYTVTVNDANNCTSVSSVTVTEPTNLSVAPVGTNVSCNGGQNGSAQVSATGGTPNYLFHWSTLVNSTSISNLSAGNYSVTVKDANNCTSMSTLIITEPSAVVASATSTDVLCYGAQTGTAQITATGGTPNYTYEWCNASTGATVNTLPSGTCSVTVTDANGCSITSSVTVNQPSQLQVVTSSANATNGQSNGNASVDNINGGVAPYSYNWSTGGTTQVITNLSSGTYGVTITDANGCTLATNVVVQEVTGINSLSGNSSVLIYPNPAKDKISISSIQTTISEIRLTDILGQTMIHQSSISSHLVELNVASLPSGAYILEVKQGEKKVLKKIVIE